ncbi:MAG: TraR/DksA family transcriptional regulator [Opitutales bacterium]
MPAKKTTAAKKAPKKAAKKAASKRPSEAKKAPAKKAAAKKSAARKQSAAKSAASAEATTKKGSSKPKASDLLKRTKHNTPAIFKVGSRKSAPVVFTLEDVREILKRRAKEEAKKPAPETKKKVAAKKAVAPSPTAAEETAAARSSHAAASLADILGFGPSGAGGGPGSPHQRTVPPKWQKYYDLLIELRTHVHESLGMHANDTLKRSQKEDTGDLSTSADAGTDTFDRDFALSVVSSEQEALAEIEAAINRIYNGTYGVCEITGETISDERLEAVPFTRFSLEGQRQYEMNARRRVSRAGAFFSEGAADGVSFGDDDGDN